MSPKILFHIPAKATQAAIILVLVICGVGVALTRTHVGREALKNQLISTFNSTYYGKLSIERLSGNLLFDLYANNVALTDSAGQTIVQIDSVFVRPSWLDLFRNKITVSSAYFQGPDVHLAVDENGVSNFARALRTRKPRDLNAPPPSRQTFSSADIRIQNGSFRTTDLRVGGSSRTPGQFDFRNGLIQDISLDVTAEWSDDSKLLEISQGRLFIPEADFRVLRAGGQVQLQEEDLVFTGLSLETQRSNVLFDGRIEGIDPDSEIPLLEQVAAAQYELDLKPGTVSLAELGRFVDGLPGSSIDLALKASGTTENIDISDLSLSDGTNRLSGRARVGIVADSVRFDLAIDESRFNPSNVASVYNVVRPEDVSHLGLISVASRSFGAYYHKTGRIRLEADFEASSARIGNLDGIATLDIGPDRRMTYRADLESESFNPGILLNDTRLLGKLAGGISIRGNGFDLASAQVEARGTLRRSVVGPYAFDTLSVDVNLAESVVSGSAFLAQAGGSVSANGQVDLGKTEPGYSLNVLARAFDLRPYLAQDSVSTRLNADLIIDGSGTTPSTFDGRVTGYIRPSSVTVGRRTAQIPGFGSELTVRKSSGTSTRIDMISDIADLHVESELDLSLLARMGEHWLDAIFRTIDIETEKAFYAENQRPAVSDSLQRARVETRRLSLANALNSFSDRYSYITEASFAVHNVEPFRTLIPNIPVIDSTFTASWYSKANADFAIAEFHVGGNSLSAVGADLGAFDVNIELEGQYGYTLEKSLRASLTARIDSLRAGGQPVDNFDLEWRFQQAASQLFATADRVGETSMFQLWANLDLLEDRNRLTIVDLSLENPNYAWKIPTDQIVDVYKDAAVFDELLIERTEVQTGLPNMIWADGILANRSGEALRIYTANIELIELSELAQVRHMIGGTLNAAVVWTGGLAEPLLTGSASVENFRVEDKTLGTLSTDMVFRPESSILQLNAAVVQPRQVSDSVLVNDLNLSGTLQIPRGTLPDGSRDVGAIDMTVDIRQLNLFFFDILFPTELNNSTGIAAGSGTIGGNFDSPVFNADLEFTESSFDIPAFNLTYSLTGELDVDQKGFHLRQMDIIDVTGGAARVNGSILFNEYRFFSFDIAATLDELQIMNVGYSRDLYWYGYIWASGPATLTGPLNDALLNLPATVTTTSSELYIPITGGGISKDDAFIIMADSTGQLPETQTRTNLLGSRPAGERTFLDGLSMNMNIDAPPGSTIHLVFDPLLGDVINAVGSGDIQIRLTGEDFLVFGDFNIDSGDYLFTVQDLLFRRKFDLDAGGRMTWNGDPINAKLAIPASYRTRASTAGLAGVQATRIPLNVKMDISGDVVTPIVDLRLEIDRSSGSLQSYENIETLLNSPGRAALYASSVLLTNSFVLAASLESTGGGDLGESGRQLVFNSLSQVVANFLNRFVSQVLENVSFNLGIHQGASLQDLDVAGGISVALLDDRILIRGEGIIGTEPAISNELTGEVVIEFRFTPNFTGQVFYRRLEELFTETVTSGGVGVSYEQSFSSWSELLRRNRPTPPDSTTIPGLSSR